MAIDPRDYDCLLHGVPSKKTRRSRKARFVMALIVILIVDLGLLAVDLASHNTSVENASRNRARSNAVLHVPTLRTSDTSFGNRRLARADF